MNYHNINSAIIEHLMWAVSTIMTRQNNIPSKFSSQMITALIPYWDMANHMNGRMTTDYDVDKNEIKCFASSAFKSEQEFCISYGCRSNYDFFLHNGFVYSANNRDEYRFKAGISKSDPLFNKKHNLLTKIGIDSCGEFVLVKEHQPIPTNLLAFSRVFTMSEGDLDEWILSSEPSDLLKTYCEIDKCLGKKMWNFLLTRIKLLLASYTTTLEEDIEILSEKEISECHKSALLLRISEKKLLENVCKYLINRSKE